MIISNLLFLWFISHVRLIFAAHVTKTGESDAREFIKSLNEKSAEIASKLVSAQWEYETNNTENTRKELFQVILESIKNAKSGFRDVVNSYSWRSFLNPDIRRQLKLYSEIGMLALPNEEYHQLQKVLSDLKEVEENSTICDFYNITKCDLHLKPDIQEKLKTCQNSDELSYLWTEWKKVTEPEFKKLLQDHVKLCNQAILLNNYTNFREYTMRNFDMKDVKQEMITLWETVEPLYRQIHAFVRKKLRNIYGDKKVPPKGPIPAHLLGDIWAENWSGIAHRMVPFPEQDDLNFTSVMITQGYTLDLTHKLAEDLFLSLNLSTSHILWFSDTSDTYLDKKAKTCHSKIFNFYNNNIRIRDCGKVSLKNYLTANKLLAKAEYMLQYSQQPYVYQNPADPGLEEAINNVVTMSVSTFKNLKKLNLYNGEITKEVRLNRLFKLALEKITTIPFLMVQEFWRWDVYSKKSIEETRCTLNDLRKKFQGISTFTKELSFNPGGLGSVFSTLSLAHNFFGYFLEFQIYESLCQMSKKNKEETESFLDECSLYENTKAGMSLRQIMQLGSSKSLKETLEPILGQNKISSKSILKFFNPLMEWLKKENERTGEFIGWKELSYFNERQPKKIRRKRSLEDYPSEEKDDDTDNSPSREPDRFQRLIHKRSKDGMEKSELSEREQKNAENTQEEIEEKSEKDKNSFAEEDEKERSDEKTARRSVYTKHRRSSTKNSNKVKENGEDSPADLDNENDNSQKSTKFSSRGKKRHSGSGGYDYSKKRIRNLNDKEENQYHKSSDDFEKKNYEGENNENKIEPGSNNKLRYTRKTRKKQRRLVSEGSPQNHQTWQKVDNNQHQKERPSRDAQWHTDTKKDISRLLHSFGFAVENDDKGKIKELKKKIKGDSNSDLKSNIASKENNFENIVEYSRMKPEEGRGDSGEEKGANKLWSIKSFMADSAKVLQSNPSLESNKKESVSSSRLTDSLLAHALEEKSIGKKETSSNNDPSLAPSKDSLKETSLSQDNESGLRNLNIDIPSLQAILKNADFTTYNQKPIYTPEITDFKVKNDINQMLGLKSANNKHGPYMYKYTQNGDMFQLNDKNDKKEYRDDIESGHKSPYIIILGEVTPDLKEQFLQEGKVSFIDSEKEPQLQHESMDEKMSDKRSRGSEQIYIIPINLKNNLLKTNHYEEHKHEADHNPDTETEEQQLHLNDDARLEDKGNHYKSGQETPSEFIISWNNDKNRKIVKRSKREHKKDIGEDKLKVVRIAPIKESVLEGLLGKSLDHSNLDDKKVKILIHDGLLNGRSGLSSALTGSSMGFSAMDQSAPASFQPSSSLSSLASSVLSALSPKSYSQVAKAASQHQDSDLDESNMKENSGSQATGAKDQKNQELPFLVNPNLRCNSLPSKKKGTKLCPDEDAKKSGDADKGEESCCKKIILTPCCPKPPTPCPPPSPTPCPCPSSPPSEPEPKKVIECPPPPIKAESPDICCKKPSECSLVNCQFKITKAKKPHERLTIMIYDRINPPAELPEPYDALAVISDILQRIQCSSCKPCQLTEEDPDYPANDNSDQLKVNQPQDNKVKIQEISGEIPILGNESPENEEAEDNPQNSQNSSNEDKYQPKEKATPAIDQLTVFNKDKLKPVFIELRKIDDIVKKRSQQE